MQKQMVCYLSVGGSLSTRKSSWKSATTVSLIQACNEITTLLNNLNKIEFQNPNILYQKKTKTFVLKMSFICNT